MDELNLLAKLVEMVVDMLEHLKATDRGREIT